MFLMRGPWWRIKSPTVREKIWLTNLMRTSNLGKKSAINKKVTLKEMLADDQNIQCNGMVITKTVKRPLIFSKRVIIVSCLQNINPFIIKEVRIRTVIGLTCSHLTLNCYDYIDSNHFFTLFIYLFRILFERVSTMFHVPALFCKTHEMVRPKNSNRELEKREMVPLLITYGGCCCWHWRTELVVGRWILENVRKCDPVKVWMHRIIEREVVRALARWRGGKYRKLSFSKLLHSLWC